MKLLTIFIILISITTTFGVLNFVTDSWIKIIISNLSSAPTPISYHSGVLNPINNTLLVFGGKDSKNIYNNLTVYDLILDSWVSANSSNATKLSPAGSIPTPRYGHVAVTTPFNTMYIFGGRNANQTFNDIYKYNMELDLWISITPTGTPPASRWGHTGVMYPIKNQFIFFGGKNSNGTMFNDLVYYDFEIDAWLPGTQPNSSASFSPTPRFGHSAIFTLTNEMVIFAGQDKVNSNSAEIYLYSAETNQWLNNTLNSTSETVAALNSHSAILTPLGTMLVFGGQSIDGTAYDSVWKFDFSQRTWKSVIPTGLGPEPRYGQTAICTLFNTMIIFGGQSSSSNYFNDLSKYNVVNSVLRSASDGVVLVVLLSLVGTMIVGLCFALDLINERNEREKYEREFKENGSELKDIKIKKGSKKVSSGNSSSSNNNNSNNPNNPKNIKKEQRQPLFETF